MKNLFSWTLALGLLTTAALPGAAQTVLVGPGTPNASAALQVESTNQGMLVPRLTSGQRTGITNAATGLLVYQTDAPAGFYYYDGSAWASLSGGGGSGGTTLPSQAGNSGKVLTTDGTTLSFTSYNKETLTVLRTAPTSANTYTQSNPYIIPPFTDGVMTQIIVVSGFYSSATHGAVYLRMPDPATVPDGARILIKRYGTSDNQYAVYLQAANYGSSSTRWFDGGRLIGAVGSYSNFNLGGFGFASGVNNNGVARYGTMLMKISHTELTNVNATANTHFSWMSILGYLEEK